MQRLDVSFWYRLSQAVAKISQIDLRKASFDDAAPFLDAVELIEALETNDILEITTSRATSEELRAALDGAWELLFTLATVEDKKERSRLRNQAALLHRKINILIDKFENILQEEMKTADVYAIRQKRIYSTRHLVERADEILGEAARSAVPQSARRDFREAGKCIAFEVPTAAGFHSMRATETVLRDWFEKQTHGKAGRRGWSNLIQGLEAAGADKATLAALDRVRDLHRNPIAHPGTFLTLDEALEVFGAAETAITAVARQIASVQRPKAKS